MKAKTFACTVLHNTCIDFSENILRNLDLTINSATQQRRPKDVIQEVLQMTSSQPITGLAISGEKFWKEHEVRDVS